MSELCDTALTFLTGVALVARFTDAGAVSAVTLQCILLHTPTLIRAAWAKGPLRTR